MIEDPVQKVEAIVKTCLYIKTLDANKLYEDTKDIRKHNRDLFYSPTALSQAIKKGVIKTDAF